MAADGLPEHLKPRILFRVTGMVAGAFLGLGLLIVMQQTGYVLLTTLSILLALFVGIALGVLLPTFVYLMSIGRANHRIRSERARRGRPAPDAKALDPNVHDRSAPDPRYVPAPNPARDVPASEPYYVHPPARDPAVVVVAPVKPRKPVVQP